MTILEKITEAKGKDTGLRISDDCPQIGAIRLEEYDSYGTINDSVIILEEEITQVINTLKNFQ